MCVFAVCVLCVCVCTSVVTSLPTDPTTLKHAYRKYTLPSESTEERMERMELRRITQTLSRKLSHTVKVSNLNT